MFHKSENKIRTTTEMKSQCFMHLLSHSCLSEISKEEKKKRRRAQNSREVVNVYGL